MKTPQERLIEIAEPYDGKAFKVAKWRRDNRMWLRKSQRIAIDVLLKIRDIGIDKSELPKLWNWTPKKVSDILKGRRNLSLKDIAKIEETLDIIILKDGRTVNQEIKK